MIEDIPAHVCRRNRQRSIAISEDMVRDIKNATKCCISVSAFIRLAVKNELEKRDKNG